MTNQNIRVTIQLYGVFRSMSSLNKLPLELPENATTSQVKAKLEEILQSSKIREILSRSVVADGTRILKEFDPVNEGMALSILPPVCGG